MFREIINILGVELGPKKRALRDSIAYIVSDRPAIIYFSKLASISQIAH